jgi:hypothetical protein
MNISPQDKAFLITFGSACLLVLVFFFTTLHPFEKQLAAEEFIDMTLIEEPEKEMPEELQKEEITAPNEPISHQLKNESRLQTEAEKFFAQEDQVRDALQQKEETENETAAEENDDYSDYKEKIEALRKKARIAKESETGEKKSKPDQKTASTSRKTTISYMLKQRNALRIPNPVYTCNAVGKVVINIQVSDTGNVTKTSFNKAASSTSNGCLVDQALDYASRASFDSAPRSAQLGSITFEFQG